MQAQSQHDLNEGQSGPTELAELTKDIVVAYLSRNAIPIPDLPSLIEVVGRELQAVSRPPEKEQAIKPERAVCVRRSIGRDQLTCLICGKRRKTLMRERSVVCLSVHDSIIVPLPERQAWR